MVPTTGAVELTATKAEAEAAAAAEAEAEGVEDEDALEEEAAEAEAEAEGVADEEPSEPESEAAAEAAAEDAADEEPPESEPAEAEAELRAAAETWDAIGASSRECSKTFRALVSGRARDMVMSSPRSFTAPLRTETRPNMAFTRVDFPAPFGPRRATISPRLIVSETLLSASNPSAYDLRRSSISRIGCISRLPDVVQSNRYGVRLSNDSAEMHNLPSRKTPASRRVAFGLYITAGHDTAMA